MFTSLNSARHLVKNMTSSDYLLPGNALREELDALQEGIELALALRTSTAAAPVADSEILPQFTNSDGSRLAYGLLVAVKDAEDGRSRANEELEKPLKLRDLCYLFGAPQIRKLLEQRIHEIQATCPDAPLTSADRRTKLRDDDAELVNRQEQEERAVLALRARGHRVLRRENLDPDVLLRVWNEPRPSATSIAEDAAALLGASYDEDEDSDEAAA